MSDERLERIKRIHAEALDLDPADRAAFLEDACGGDDELRSEIESLLLRREEMGRFLEAPASERLSRFAPPELAVGVRVGNYEVQGVLGSGGSGTVYEALQQSPRRRAALKVMHADLTSESALRRFRDEAEILARLQHPDIAHVYEAGVHEAEGAKLPWFALEYVESGRNVVAYAEAEGLDARGRLALVARVCMAIHHGHQKGIIHRDIKPANLLVDASGRLKVIDFGIARIARDRPDDAPREIAGTLPYMSPEQCRMIGDDVDVRSDVYALGVLLYELLTGRLPHEVTDTPITEATRRIREEAPRPIAALDRSLRGDVELIVHKALAKYRAERYQSAADLGRDLRRFLESRPITARRPSWHYHARLFARRRTGVVLGLAALLVVLVGAAIVSTMFGLRAERDRRAAVAAHNLEKRQSYLANVAAADAALRVFDVADARRRLLDTAPDLRNWEWFYLAGRLDRSERTLRGSTPNPFFHLALCPDGSRMSAVSGDPSRPSSVLLVWDTATGEVLAEHGPVATRFRSPAFSPDGKQLAWGEDSGEVVLADAVDPVQATRWKAHAFPLTSVVFAADGALLITAASGGPIKLWKPDGKPVRTLGQTGRYVDLALDPTGTRLAVSESDKNAITIWDLSTGEPALTLEGHRAPVESLDFSPDGDRLVSGARDATLRIWDARSGEARRVLTRREHVSDVRYSRDGARILSGHVDGTVTVWDATTGVEIETLWGHARGVTAVGWGPGPRDLCSASLDGSVKTWRLRATRVETVLARHEQLVRDVAYSPDGSRLASAWFDGAIRLHDTQTGEEVMLLEGHEQEVQSVAFSPDGKLLASGGNDWMLRLWDLETGEGRLVCGGHTAGVLCVAISPDGSMLASSSNDGSAIVWDAETGDRLHTVVHSGWVWSVRFSPDGRLIATAATDGTLRLWSVDTGEEVRRIRCDSGLVGVRFDGDGSRVLSIGALGALKLWDVASGEMLADFEGAGAAAQAADFSSDGTRLAVASGRSVRLLELETGRLALILRGHKAPVYDVAFHPDGTQIASAAGGWGGEDCTVRLWGRIPGQPWPPD